MDNIDMTILNCLQDDAHSSLKEMSQLCYISSSAVSNHVKNMEKLKIIYGYQALVDVKKLGYHIKCHIWIDVSPESKEDFYEFIYSVPNILECDCITGNYNMLIKAVFKETEDLDYFINNRLNIFGRTKTQISFSTPMRNRGLILEQEEDINSITEGS
ncbi:MAG: Lrp/AsnC family transcriptional regulator [Streptococcaceae bacterium]|nr:Lrp/AsnC family transcriptional regulator [Streptococcaceae bacterium]MCH4178061.1 Lrp/AsnC family transcriptional regulator [Streptococcaceae bacterium]